MSRELVAYVHVAGRVFAPGDDVPDEYAKRITNPAAWSGEAPAKAEESDPYKVPPRAGKGSGREAWARFAHVKGFDAAEDETRDDIIRNLEELGVIEREA